MLRVIRPAGIVLALLLLRPSSAHAAASDASTPPAAQLRAIDASTRAAIVLIDSLMAVPAWVSATQLAPQRYADDRASVRSCLERLTQLEEANDGARWRSELRWRQVTGAPAWQSRAAYDDLAQVAFFLATYLEGPYARSHGGDPRLNAMLAPIDSTFLTPLTRAALDGSMERLRRYQIKFGPQSVPLNYVEAALAFGLQRLPVFGPSVERGPSPWEPVASYTALYSSIRDRKLVGTSMVEFGLRHYQFGDVWGRGGMKGLLRPRWFAFGLAVAPQVEGPLQKPFGAGTRYGGFVAWGDLKLAIVHGDRTRVLVTRQLQFMKNVF